MKKDLIIAAAMMLSTVALPSCSNEEDETSPVSTKTTTEQLTIKGSVTVKCGDEGLSKATLNTSDMTLLFTPNEEAALIFTDEDWNIDDCVKFTSTNTVNAAETDFKGTVDPTKFTDAGMIIAAIPYSAWKTGELKYCLEQTAVEDGFDPNAFIADGLLDVATMSVTFEPSVPLLKINATADYNTLTISYFRYTYKVSGIKSGKTYYVPVVTATGGITVTFKNGEDEILKLYNANLKNGYYYTVNL